MKEKNKYDATFEDILCEEIYASPIREMYYSKTKKDVDFRMSCLRFYGRYVSTKFIINDIYHYVEFSLDIIKAPIDLSDNNNFMIANRKIWHLLVDYIIKNEQTFN